jgi:hypothetical protein
MDEVRFILHRTYTLDEAFDFFEEVNVKEILITKRL